MNSSLLTMHTNQHRIRETLNVDKQIDICVSCDDVTLSIKLAAYPTYEAFISNDIIRRWNRLGNV